MVHLPVLQKEVIEYLNPMPNGNFIDATIGEGGHTAAILEKNGPRGKVLGIDEEIRIKPKDKRIVLIQDNFVNLKKIIEKSKFKSVSGILFDLGMSSWHLEESGRGFSFQRKEPLDMRYNQQNQLTAEKIVNFWSKIELEKIFKEYGEERARAEKIAERIIEARPVKPISNTMELIQIIKISPRLVFQALRIAVNDELNNIAKALPQAIDLLDSGGRIAVISFHSLEDRLVKNFLRDKAREGKLQILTKKPVVPSEAEVRSNPRSRSAKLRAAAKL